MKARSPLSRTATGCSGFALSGSEFEVTAKVKLDVPTAAVAVVSRPVENEVVVILSDGYAIRVRRP
ncbi:MAG: hypothetical protein U0792_04550 [Gemmataceae bacterium]